MTSTGSNSRGCKLLVATALAFGMLTTASLAHTPEQEQMCAGDAMRLCSSEIPNVDRITACMHRQRASLSDGCKAVFRKESAGDSHSRQLRTGQSRQADQSGSGQGEVINTIDRKINPRWIQRLAGCAGELLSICTDRARCFRRTVSARCVRI